MIRRRNTSGFRAGLERDYRDHFRRYILPKFEDTKLCEVTPAILDAFRAYLLHERQLSIKSVRNIIDASFRACFRDARTVDYLPELQGKDPFAALQWPRIKTAKPDPFTEEERDVILEHFCQKIPYYYPFVFTLFWTGMRPSEALALRWGDIDLRRHELSVSKSRYLEEEAGTKTAASEREIRLLSSVTDLLRGIKPLNLTEETHVFLNQEGNPVNFHTWRAKVWYRALRAKEMRKRRPYTMRHTFISTGLSNGVNIKWLADYCGTSVAMIEKHYGKYIRNDADEQLGRLFGAHTVTSTVTQQKKAAANTSKGLIFRGNKMVGPPGFEPGTNRL
jgi:integrase